MVNRFADVTCNELAESMFQPKGAASSKSHSLNNSTHKIVHEANSRVSADAQLEKESTNKASHQPRKIESKKSI